MAKKLTEKQHEARRKAKNAKARAARAKGEIKHPDRTYHRKGSCMNGTRGGPRVGYDSKGRKYVSIGRGSQRHKSPKGGQ